MCRPPLLELSDLALLIPDLAFLKPNLSFFIHILGLSIRRYPINTDQCLVIINGVLLNLRNGCRSDANDYKPDEARLSKTTRPYPGRCRTGDGLNKISIIGRLTRKLNLLSRSAVGRSGVSVDPNLAYGIRLCRSPIVFPNKVMENNERPKVAILPSFLALPESTAASGLAPARIDPVWQDFSVEHRKPDRAIRRTSS